jgi:hypothetical protein
VIPTPQPQPQMGDPAKARYALCSNDKREVVADLSKSDLVKKELGNVVVYYRVLNPTGAWKKYTPDVATMDNVQINDKAALMLSQNKGAILMVTTTDYLAEEGMFQAAAASAPEMLKCSFKESDPYPNKDKE